MLEANDEITIRNARLPRETTLLFRTKTELFPSQLITDQINSLWNGKYRQLQTEPVLVKSEHSVF